MSIADITRSVLLAAQGVNAIGRDLPRIFPTEINILNFPGVDNTGATDSSAAIQAALNSLSPGVNVIFPAGTYNLGSNIYLGNGNGVNGGTVGADSTIYGIRLVGRGVPGAPGSLGYSAGNAAPVKFLWSGVAGGIMVTVAGPLQGWGLENFLFDAGATVAGTGVNVVSASLGDCKNLSYKGFSGEAFISQAYGTYASVGHALAMHNTFINTYIQVPDLPNAIGIILTGTVTGQAANTCYNNFINTTIDLPITSTTIGVIFQGCDSISFKNLHFFHGNNSIGIRYDYSVTSAWPTAVIIDGVDTASLAIQYQNVGSPGQFARTNYVIPFEANGAVVPALSNSVNLIDSAQSLPWGVAGGISDSLVMTYDQTFNNLPDGKLVFARTIAANITTQPLFQMTDNGAGSGFAAAPIYKYGTTFLNPGDLTNRFDAILRFNGIANTATAFWELMNPATVQPPWSNALGTNALTAAYSPPNPALYTGLLLGAQIATTNATSVITFAPDGLSAQLITKYGGVSLVPGDLPGNTQTLLRYNGTTHWELLNPSSVGILWNNAAGGSANNITATFAPANFTVYDGLQLGYRAATLNTSTSVVFAPDGLTTHTVTKYGGKSLNPGDITTGAEYILRYSGPNTRWELLNPSTLSPAATTAGGLPSGTFDGLRAFVTDSNSTTYFTVYTGGGTLHSPIWFDSSAGGWRVG